MTEFAKGDGAGLNMDELYELFKQRAESISAVVHRVPDSAGALSLVRDVIAKKGVATVAAAVSPLVEGLALDQVEEVSVYTSGLRRRAEEAELGISEMDVAVAETGTLAQDATDADKRLVSMLPPVHIALVPTGKLVKTLRDALHLKAGSAPPVYYAFISGPSRTADIERVLTVGVHGPGELYVVFIDGTGGMARVD